MFPWDYSVLSLCLSDCPIVQSISFFPKPEEGKSPDNLTHNSEFYF